MPTVDPHAETATRRRRGRGVALAAVLLAGTALGGFAAGHSVLAADSQTEPSHIQPGPIQGQLPDFASLVKEVKPAVVSITSHLKVSAADDDSGIPPQFRRMVPGMGNGMGNGRPQAIEARGSGFIVNPDGIVVTNNHVVRDATSVQVTLDDGTTLPAKIIGRDPRTDLAVLKVSADHKLPFISLGNSNDVLPGQWVVAVGNPFGLGGTVTAGIVSARGRDIGDGPYDQFLQIDAPINQGNSGGPLFNQDGQVIGVNTAILSPSGGSVGIGFAIPSNTVKTVIAQLEKTGHVARGYLGVEAQPVNAAMGSALDIPAKGGALVASVMPDSPASQAGIQPGDVIEKVNGQDVTNPRDLAIDVAAVAPGGQATFDLVRDGQAKSITTTLTAIPDQQTADAAGTAAPTQRGVGLALAPLTPDMRDQLNLPGQVRGAVVANVQSGSPADRAGIQQGDVIVGVNTKTIDSPDQAATAIRGAIHGGHSVALRILRDGHAAFVAVNPGAAAAGQGDSDQG